METEAKLGFKNKDELYGLTSADYFRKLCIDASEPSPVLLENTYLDTEDMDISGRGGMIRVRHFRDNSGDHYEFTVKYGGGVSGSIHKRLEWNVKSDDGIFSVEDFKRKASGSEDSPELLSEALGNISDSSIKVLCSNSFNRTVYNLAYGESLIEACFDSGIISSSDGLRTDEICELELELKKGNVEDLTGLADLISSRTGCFPFEKTKYSRTLAMVTGK